MVVSSSPHSFCSCWYYEWHLEDRPWPRCDPRLVVLGPTVPWHGNPCANVAGCGRCAQGCQPAPRRRGVDMISTWNSPIWCERSISKNLKKNREMINCRGLIVWILISMMFLCRFCCLVQYLIPAVPFLFRSFQLHLFQMPWSQGVLQ